MAKPMRASMPQCAAFIDECREAFGADEINAQIRLGMQGAQTFYATENGIEVGTPMPRFEDSPGILLRDMVVRPSKTQPTSTRGKR